jgi:hypothetical protein
MHKGVVVHQRDNKCVIGEKAMLPTDIRGIAYPLFGDFRHSQTKARDLLQCLFIASELAQFLRVTSQARRNTLIGPSKERTRLNRHETVRHFRENVR